MMELMFVVLLFCSVLTVTGESNVTGSQEPVHVTVGQDVILPCHLEPPYDVTTLAVEWKWNEIYVCIHRSRGYNKEDVPENFSRRTSLFLDELIRGNISLKLTNVTEQDEGNYTCFVPKLDSQVRRGFIHLIVDSEENRNKGNQNNSDQKTTESNKNKNNRLYGFIALIIFILIIVAIVVFLMWTRCVNHNPRGGQDRGEPQEELELYQMDDHGQEGVEPQEEHELDPLDDLGAGQDRGEPQEEIELALVDDPRAGQDGGRRQEEHEGAAIDGNIQPGRRGKCKPVLRTDSHVRQRQVRILNY